ncbi:MAG: hypothetical protein K2Q14_00470 [Gammaproteobacteria bacterium]|nr:hypothetical protein [Gammaproteobacteria bacterium]
MTNRHNKINPEKLLSTLHHDLVNIFFGTSVANDASAKYYTKLLAAYRKLSQADKEGLNISSNILELLEQNFSIIKQEMSFGSYYIKSMRYNFCDYQDCTLNSIDIGLIIVEAKKYYQMLFQKELLFDEKISVTEKAIVNANHDILLNIMVRFFMLDKHYPLTKVNLLDADNYYKIEFCYEAERILQTYLADLDDPTLDLPEASMAFNLSLCHNYTEHMGGKTDYLYKHGQTYFIMLLPKGVAYESNR